jgi:hypothetical protein
MSKLLIFGSEVEVEDEADMERERDERLKPCTPEPQLPMLIDVAAFEAKFLECCIEHGWITAEHDRGEDLLYVTEKGRRELARFGLTTLC